MEYWRLPASEPRPQGRVLFQEIQEQLRDFLFPTGRGVSRPRPSRRGTQPTRLLCVFDAVRPEVRRLGDPRRADWLFGGVVVQLGCGNLVAKYHLSANASHRRGVRG